MKQGIKFQTPHNAYVVTVRKGGVGFLCLAKHRFGRAELSETLFDQTNHDAS